MSPLKLLSLFGTSILLFTCIEVTSAKNWAVILVGLDYYELTYAFEAGACKLYNTLVKHGILPENIIMISPDTAAYHPNNCVPGLLAYAYEKSDFTDSYPVNQYEDVPIDYSGKELTESQFYQILSGNKTKLNEVGSGRVVQSGPHDNIFLYVHTVGIEGMMLLNNNHIIFANNWIPVMEKMAESKAFKSMFIHMHSSSPGSMFDNYMETNLRILVYSMGGRYDDFSMCHKNPYLNAYTSTCQGFEHFAYLDKVMSRNGAKETIFDLYSGSGLTSLDTTLVHNLYGDITVARRPIKEFFGPKMRNSRPLAPNEINEQKNKVKKQTQGGKSILKVLTEEVPPQDEQIRISNIMNKVISESIYNTKVPRNIVDEPLDNLPFKKYDCYKKAVEALRSKCLTKKSEFVFLKYASKFAQLCRLDVPKNKIVSTINSSCQG